MKTEFVHCKDKTDVANTEAQVNCRFEGVFDEALAFIMKYQLMRPDGGSLRISTVPNPTPSTAGRASTGAK